MFFGRNEVSNFHSRSLLYEMVGAGIMDLSDAPSPQKSDFKPSFRKPSNDIANRKYRRHSPAAGSDSSSSGG